MALCSNCDPCSSKIKFRGGFSSSFSVCSVELSLSPSFDPGWGMSNRKTVCFFGMANIQVSKDVAPVLEKSKDAYSSAHSSS